MQKAHHEPITNLLHFSHIEKTLKKAVQELVDFCMVFLETFYKKNGPIQENSP